MKKNIVSITMIAALTFSIVACSNQSALSENREAQSKLALSSAAVGAIQSTDEMETSRSASPSLDSSQFTLTSQLSETKKDPLLENAIKGYLMLSDIDYAQIKYYYNHLDLNQDGVDETIVYLIGPPVSGTGGDTFMIFNMEGEKYTLMQMMTLVRNPFIISDHSTNGYKDIIIEQSGGGIAAAWKVLQYDGKQYSNIDQSEVLGNQEQITGTEIIANDVFTDIQEEKGYLVLD